MRNYLPGEVEVNRAIDAEIDSVVVEGNEATFSGIVTYDNFDPSHSNYKLGERFYFSVVDGGTPGECGDIIRWGWSDSDPLTYTGDIYEGNLVVHNN